MSLLVVILPGMSELVKERPTDPVEWLAAFLLRNNPNKPVPTAPPGAPQVSTNPPSASSSVNGNGNIPQQTSTSMPSGR